MQIEFMRILVDKLWFKLEGASSEDLAAVTESLKLQKFKFLRKIIDIVKLMYSKKPKRVRAGSP